MALFLRPSAAAAAAVQRQITAERCPLLLGNCCRSREMENMDNQYSHRPLPQQQQQQRYCDVFINHRGVDTKQSVAGLLYDRLLLHNLRPFLDNRSMGPGDKLYDSIHSGIHSCKVGIAIFSPRYCESLFCLHELAMLVEAKKKLIPIFFDVKPSKLHHLLHHYHQLQPDSEMLERFSKALQEAKDTVGLSFDSHNGNWSELICRTTDIVVKSIKEGGDC